MKSEKAEPRGAGGTPGGIGQFVGGVVGCEITLIGEIDPTMACTGEVRIGGDIIPRDDPNGWRAIDSTHIELLGTACDRLTSTGDEVTGTFPCEAILM